MSGCDLSKDELLTLLETAGELATEMNRDKLVGMVLDKACLMTGSPDGSVLLYDRERKGLYFAAATGSKGPELLQKWGEYSSQRVPVEGSKAGAAFLSGGITIGTSESHFKGVDEQTGKQSVSIVSVALQVAGQSIGVLQVLNKPTAYDDRDCELLRHFGRLAASALNNTGLVRRLTAQMGLYSKFADDDLIARLDQPAERETMSVMFADLRGFTQLCSSQADPARTQEILNDLLTMFADVVLSRRGIVNKFVGDAVLALYRGKEGPKRAVRSAFDMLERFGSLRRLWDERCNEDLTFLDLGIGIATGSVALGPFGSSEVRDFTAIGNAVNLASAFEAAARNGRRVLIDNATWKEVQDIVGEADGPTPFQLGKPGQTVMVNYRHFHLKRVTADRPVRVFISHSHRDREFVERAITLPLKQHGIETWYSREDIIPGQNYVTEIENALLKCDWVFVVVSENSAGSDWVRAEVATALRDKRFENRVVPLNPSTGKAAQILPALGQLHGLDIDSITDPGEALYAFLMDREIALRAAAR